MVVEVYPAVSLKLWDRPTGPAPHSVRAGRREDGMVGTRGWPGRGGVRGGVWVVGWVGPAVAVAAVVARSGELSRPALAAVVAAGVALAGIGVARRAGSAAAAAGRAGWPWLTWLAALAGWELYTRVLDRRLPTLSDLLDPVLAHRVIRGVATVGWFAVGVWLLRRPSSTGGDRRAPPQ